MNNLFTSSKALKRIIDRKESFSSGVKSVCKPGNSANEERKDVTTLVGCALRHYLILENRFAPLCGDNKDYLYYAIVACSNILFARKVSKEESFTFLKENIEDKEVLDKVVDAINKFEAGEPLISKDLDPNCLEFLSFRYNTPLWIVRMWRKHYGYKDMRKILIANSKHFNNYARINTEIISEEEFEKNNGLFSKTQFDKFYLYNDKSKIKKSFQYSRQEIYVYPIVFDEMIKEADTDTFRGIGAYAATPNGLASALAANLTSYVEMDFLFGKQQAYFETKEEKTLFNLKNIHLYEGGPESGITCFSKKVHTFFVFPDSSKFFLLRNTPDYFIHFEQNSLDGLLKDQAIALEEGSKFVEDGGYLAYYVGTISEKESHGIVEKFLAAHPEFSLVNEKRIFPFSEYDSTGYYAVLRKAETND